MARPSTYPSCAIVQLSTLCLRQALPCARTSIDIQRMQSTYVMSCPRSVSKARQLYMNSLRSSLGFRYTQAATRAIDGTFLGAVACDQMATLPLILWDGD